MWTPSKGMGENTYEEPKDAGRYETFEGRRRPAIPWKEEVIYSANVT